MEYVKLRSGSLMPYVGLGTFPLMGETLNSTVWKAKNTGYQLFDTAGVYKNEDVLGLAIRSFYSNRSDVFISSKVHGCQLRGRMRYLFLDRESVRSAYKHSCKRLGVDYLDLFLIHQPFNGYCDAYKEMISLYEQGKVKAIGVSNFDNDELKKIHRVCGQFPMVNQTEISPLNSFKGIIRFCQDNDIQVEAYSPFGRGNLVNVLLNDEKLKLIAMAHNRTVGQIVLRWIVQQRIVVIPRSTNEIRLRENLDVFDFHLSDSEMKIIDSMNKNKVFGANQIHKVAVNG